MRRIHLFEIEDLDQCPVWLRNSITSMLLTVHRWFDTASVIESHLTDLMPDDFPVTIIDLCSGSGGPMPEVVSRLTSSSNARVELRLTDLFPDPEALEQFNSPNSETDQIKYETESIDATSVPNLVENGRFVLRTMVCSFHHLSPDSARAVLADAQNKRQPMLMFEMSDNSVPPIWLWWITLLPNFLFGVLVSLMTGPWSIRRLFFTLVVPIIPAAFAWDGAVSNVRTYNQQDFEQLLRPIKDAEYDWSVEVVSGRLVNHLIVVGQPVETNRNN